MELVGEGFKCPNCNCVTYDIVTNDTHNLTVYICIDCGYKTSARGCKPLVAG